MNGIFQAIVDFFSFILSFISLFLDWLGMLIKIVITPFRIFVTLDSSGTPAIPTVILSFILAGVIIGILFKVFGRHLGK